MLVVFVRLRLMPYFLLFAIFLLHHIQQQSLMPNYPIEPKPFLNKSEDTFQKVTFHSQEQLCEFVRRILSLLRNLKML